MSYEKAMKHTANVRKCRKQSRQYMGFGVSSTPWPNPRRNPEVALCIRIAQGFRYRHFEDGANAREFIRDDIAKLRALRGEAA